MNQTKFKVGDVVRLHRDYLDWKAGDQFVCVDRTNTLNWIETGIVNPRYIDFDEPFELVSAPSITELKGSIEKSRNKYMREIAPGVWIDVYDVLYAFEVTDPCLQHLIKKALAVGKRGFKDARQDLVDIRDSAVRALETHDRWNDVQ